MSPVAFFNVKNACKCLILRSRSRINSWNSHLVSQCFLLTVPFRGMLLTPQGGPRCLAPTAHQIPVYLMVFSTFLCRACTAHYLYTPWQLHSSMPLARRTAMHASCDSPCHLSAKHGLLRTCL